MCTDASVGVWVRERGFVAFDVVEYRDSGVCFWCGKEPLWFGEGDEDFIYFRRKEFASGGARGEKSVVGLGDFDERELREQSLPVTGLVGVGISGFSRERSEVKITCEVAERGGVAVEIVINGADLFVLCSSFVWAGV